ncbi:MAG TPA: type II secretion system F family protein [Mycobacteriales bacterium]|nr:type II secretion system F family protein [Mycobacteriales bacterium]
MRPSLDAVVAALIAAGFGAAVAMLAYALRGGTPGPRPPGRAVAIVVSLRSPATSGRFGAGIIAGVVILLVTRWPVAAVGIAALVLAWPVMFGGARAERAQIDRLEALVMWTEALRDTVTARASLEQAIPATATHAAGPIRPALIRLVGRLRARVPLDAALLALSAELDDASADKVIGALVLNTRQRGSGLAVVLGALARSGRDELDQRRRITAGRASMRRSVQLVVAITVAFAVLLATFSRSYVAPYSSLGGQVALTVVVGLFAASFVWLRRLAGGEPATPFLTAATDPRSAETNLRIVHQLTGLGRPASAAGPQHAPAGRHAGVSR